MKRITAIAAKSCTHLQNPVKTSFVQRFETSLEYIKHDALEIFL